MRPSRLLLSAIAVALLGLSGATLALPALRVMTFNVRFPNPNDGANRWELRRDLMVRTIREQYPDVLGTQEL